MWVLALLHFENSLHGLAATTDLKDGGGTVESVGAGKQSTKMILTMLPGECCCRPRYRAEPG